MTISENLHLRRAIDLLSNKILGAAIEVHKVIGPVAHDAFYFGALQRELRLRQLDYEIDFRIPFQYKREVTEVSLNSVILVEGKVTVEIAPPLTPFNSSLSDHVMRTMKLLNAPKGMILNFRCNNMFHEGHKSVISSQYNSLT